MVDAEWEEKIAVVLDDEAGIESRDEALYWLITTSLRSRLERRFRPFAQQVPFSFEDALQDYFLYLRGDGREAYSVFKSVKDSSSADAWMLSTFRNFLGKTVRSADSSVMTDAEDVSDVAGIVDGYGEQAREIRQITQLSTILAYCYQELPQVQRFVFLRMILTHLDRSRALPQKDVATVLGMSHVYYRVLNNRVSSVMNRVKTSLLNGVHLHLNPEAADMRKALLADFNGWYDLLAVYYEKTISSFAQAEEINTLRYQQYYDSAAPVLHDSQPLPAYCLLELLDVQESDRKLVCGFSE